MKFKHTLRNYLILLMSLFLHIPIAILLKIIWCISSAGDWIEDNICTKLDVEYSYEYEYDKVKDKFIKRNKDETM